MILNLKPYPVMKDSSVEWLGDVPAHWEVRRLKYLLRERDARSVYGREQLLRVSQYTGVTERKRDDGADEPDTRAESLVGYKRVDPDELVVNIMLAWNGSMGVSAFSGIASPAYCVYRFGGAALPWYFHNLLRSPVYKARIKAVSTGIVESRLRLYTNDLYRLEGLLPPLPEQAAIVRFLDYMDRRLRHYIRAKQKLIGLLEEQKQAIIHRAVTCGIDPDVPLKPSGIEWLGDVPEHWEVIKIRHFARVGNGSTPSRGRTDYWSSGHHAWLNSSIVNRERVNEADQFVTDVALKECHLPRLVPGDILVAITGQGKTRGKSAVLAIEATINQHLSYVHLRNNRMLPEYLQLVFTGAYAHLRSISDDSGSTKGALTCADIRHFKVPLPPLVEQHDVLDWVRQENEASDLTIEVTLRSIDLLREYSTRLIADVVTGKVDVRGIEVPEVNAEELEETKCISKDNLVQEMEESL